MFKAPSKRASKTRIDQNSAAQCWGSKRFQNRWESVAIGGASTLEGNVRAAELIESVEVSIAAFSISLGVTQLNPRRPICGIAMQGNHQIWRSFHPTA